MSWENILKKANANDPRENFPKEIMHDGIKYYLAQVRNYHPKDIGIYRPYVKHQTDQILHIYLDEAMEKKV
tara:strand:- start:1214 stop:1426 length:213 start_codon:yes stop_codon:yes gene_type:complete